MRFLKAFLRKPGAVGAIAPTSKVFAKAMVNSVDWGRVQYVAEFGTGTGVITDVILKAMRPGTRYMGIEIDPELCRIFRQRHPGVLLRRDSAADIERLCKEEKFGTLDVIISGLPFASFKLDLQESILAAAERALKPGGLFMTFGYQIGTLLPAGRRFHRNVVPKFFRKVSRSRVVWRNLPPAFFITCHKAA